MEILEDSIMPSDWLVGSKRMWIHGNPSSESDNGNVIGVEQWPRPLLHFTFDAMPGDRLELENLFILCNGVSGFLCKPPLEDDYLQVDGDVGIGTGSPTAYQLRIGRGVIWNAIYPIEDTIIIYFNGVAQLTSPSVWTLGDEGVITITAPSSVEIRATFEYYTPFMFTEQSIETNLVTEEVQQVRGVSIRELFV